MLGLEPETKAGALHNGAAGRGVAAHEQRNSQDAFVAYHRYFSRCATLQYIQQRHNRRGRKVHMFELPAGLVQHATKRHFSAFELGPQALKLGHRQGCEQVVLQRVVLCIHERRKS